MDPSASTETATSNTLLGKKVKNKCLICQSDHTDFLSSSKDLDQLKLFKKLVFCPSFRKSLTSRRTAKSKKLSISNNKSCCSVCLSTVNKVWCLHQKLEALQKEIETVIANTQKDILLKSGVEDTLEDNLDDVGDVDVQNLLHLKEDVNISCEVDLDALMGSIKQEYESEEEVGSVEDDNEEWLEGVQHINIKSEVVEVEVEQVWDEGHITNRSTRGSKRKAQAGAKRGRQSQPKRRRKIESDSDSGDSDDKREQTPTAPTYKCLHDNCELTFDRRTSRANHFKTVHNGVYQCPECSATFPRNKVLTIHKERVHLQLKNFNCEHCPKQFYDKSEYTLHVRTHTGERHFQCSKCGKSYNSMQYLNIHTKAYCKQSEADPEFVRELKEKKAEQWRAKGRNYGVARRKETVICDECGKSMQRMHLLDHKKRVHQRIKNQNCAEFGCGKVFYTRKDLQRHLTLVHKVEIPSTKVQCEHCGLEFPHMDMLFVHRKKAHQDGEFKCDICPMTFRTRLNLEKHQGTHTKDQEKSFTCSDCGKGFSHSGYLRRHQSNSKGSCPSRKFTATAEEQEWDLGTVEEGGNQVGMNYLETPHL